jgi:Ca-activated chloride channel family protein
MFKHRHPIVYFLSLILILILGLGLNGCGLPAARPGEVAAVATPMVTLVTNPVGEQVVAGQQVAIAAEATGLDLKFKWSVERGAISKTEGQSIIYTAPAEPGLDVVNLIVTGNGGENSKTKTFSIVPGLPDSPEPPTLPGVTSSVPSTTVVISLASSNTKDIWIEQATQRFNEAKRTTTSGKIIEVKAGHVLSGGSKDDILNGVITPTVWSPGDAFWVTQLNKTLLDDHRPALMSSDTCPNTVYSPLGIAMWKPMAEALGWPAKPIGWKTIVELAEDPEGWAKYSHSEWGKFQFGHAHPLYSNAGFQTMTAIVYSLADKTSLTSPEANTLEGPMRALQQRTSKYSFDTANLLNSMAEYGPGFLHAVATYESTMLKVNLDSAAQLWSQLVFIFPEEGTFWSGHPYCVLDKAARVTPEQVEAANIFLDYLLQPDIQDLAIANRLRPVIDIPLHAPISREDGTDPNATLETVPPLPDPDAELGDSIKELFVTTKRKATIIVALDTSGSMRGEPMAAASQATVEFLERLNKEDVVTVLTFDDIVEQLAEPDLKGSTERDGLKERVLSVIAEGNTALYRAVCQAEELMAELRQQDQAQNDSRLYGIVLLSDGEDTQGNPTKGDMFTNCLPSSAEADGVKIFTIAFGAQADRNLLRDIAHVTGGELFEADSASISRIYREISAEQ